MPPSTQRAQRNTSGGLLAPNEEAKRGEHRTETPQNVMWEEQGQRKGRDGEKRKRGGSYGVRAGDGDDNTFWRTERGELESVEVGFQVLGREWEGLGLSNNPANHHTDAVSIC